jgi:hypothetical protein
LVHPKKFKDMRIITKLKNAAAVGSLLLSLTASAATYIEVGDAGETLGTAQAVGGGYTAITGSVTTSDADLFSFNWGGGDFYANTVGSTFDSQLFLFSSTGVGIQGNDDGIAFAGPAYLQIGGLAAGAYYIGVSAYDYDPYSSGGLMFQSFPYEPLYGPLNGDPLTHWASGDGVFSSGAYSINFQQITSNGTPIGDPTPTGVPDAGSSVALLGLGLASLAAIRRKIA